MSDEGLAPGWYVTDEFFANGGVVVADLGPFGTLDLALRVRALYEALRGRDDLFVDEVRVSS